jgi:hypothetical protein
MLVKTILCARHRPLGLSKVVMLSLCFLERARTQQTSTRRTNTTQPEILDLFLYRMINQEVGKAERLLFASRLCCWRKLTSCTRKTVIFGRLSPISSKTAKDQSSARVTVTCHATVFRFGQLIFVTDISLVPTLDLPLQRILTFRACPAPVATSYFQGLCSAEGFLVERDSLAALYDSTCKSIDTRPASSSMSSEFPVPDLRRTINCLHFRCLTMGTIPPSGSTVQWQTSECLIEDLADWTYSMTRQSSPSVSAADAEFSFMHDSVINHADLISFVDGRLVRSGLDGSEVSMIFLGPMLRCSDL